jgi:hypothetical protein
MCNNQTRVKKKTYYQIKKRDQLKIWRKKKTKSRSNCQIWMGLAIVILILF